ncbi:MAG: alpha/beta hydrolase [Deinococcota bacterium]
MNITQSKDGTTLSYDVYGNGPTLIYITGASCFRNFGPIKDDAKIFAKEFTVYNYDRRGRGDSGDTQPYAVEREVEDIEALIDAAGGNANLYGHSSGAVLALEAALHIPEKINNVVMYDPSYVHDEVEQATYAQLSQKVHQHLAEGQNRAAMQTFLRGIGMPRFFVWLLPLLPGWKTMAALAPTLAYDIELTKDVPPVERATQVSVPVNIVVGEKSPASIHEVAKQLVAAIPDARLEQLAGQDHMVSAKALLPVLVKFLQT